MYSICQIFVKNTLYIEETVLQGIWVIILEECDSISFIFIRTNN